MKNSFDRVTCRLNTMEGKTSELENGSTEMIQMETQRIKNSERKNITKHQELLKQCNICVIRVPEDEEASKISEFSKIKKKNISNHTSKKSRELQAG